jgi:hypothetical protein
MKNILILFLAFLFCLNINAQDIITLKNGKVIHAYITERSDTKIKYMNDSISKGDTTYSMKLARIRTLQYDNGEVDLLSSQNPRSIFPLGINAGVNIFEVVSGGIDYLFTPNISAEINIGGSFRYVNYYYYSFGGKYWFANKYSKSGFSPFLGLFYTKSWARDEEYMWVNKPEWSSYNYVEAPIGVSYITKFGFQTSLQLDSYLGYDSNRFKINVSFFEFRIGWRFK